MDAVAQARTMLGSATDLEGRYDRLLREHGPALRRAAAAYEFDPARREDLFQDICLAVWQALPRFRGEASERTFLFRIAHNRGLTHRSARTLSAPAGRRFSTRRCRGETTGTETIDPPS